MNEIIKNTIEPILSAFDRYDVTYESLNSEIDIFKNKLIDFAHNNDDPALFFPAYSKSGLQEEYASLISRAAMSIYTNNYDNDNDSDSVELNNKHNETSQSNMPDSTLDTDLETTKIYPTIDEFLEGYKIAYNEVCKRDSVVGRAAYEELFDVANSSSDILDAQINIEKKQLLWKIVRNDAIEILCNKLCDLDILNLASTATLIGQINSYLASNCEEELIYRLDMEYYKNIKIVLDYEVKIFICANISKILIDYIKAKEAVYQWHSDRLAHTGVCAMKNSALKIRKINSFIQSNLNFSVSDLISKDFYNIWFLNPQNTDEYGKSKKCMNPQNLEVYKDLLENEILNNLPLKDALLRDTEMVFWFQS